MTTGRMIRKIPTDIHATGAFTLTSDAIGAPSFAPRSVRVVRCSLCSSLVIDDAEGADFAAHEQHHVDVAFSLRELADSKADA